MMISVALSSVWLFLAYVALLVVSVTLLFGAVFSVYVFSRHRKYAHIPGPERSSFFLGNLAALQEGKEQGKAMHDLILEWTKSYGPVFVLYLAHHAFVVILDSDAVKYLLVTSNAPKPRMAYAPLFSIYNERFMGCGLATEVDHDKWLKKRELLNPAFHRKFLMNLMRQFNDSADLLIQKLEKCADGKTPVSMLDEFNHVTLDVIAKYLPFNGHVRREVQEAIRLLRKTGLQEIERRLAARHQGEQIKDDILGHILRASDFLLNPEFQIENALDEFVTFFIAGQETTASQMSFTLMELLRYPEIEHRVRTEIDAILNGRMAIQYEDIGRMSYTSKVLKESLRLYPPAGRLLRQTVKDEVFANIRIPAHSVVMLSTFAMSRMEEYFEDPLIFNPERFDQSESILKYACFPFSLGPRICIGQNFAQIEAKVLLARLLTAFNFTWLPGQSYDMEDNLTNRPKDGCKTYITRRDT
ncbi:cholesterol 24-hydroxylase-like isoform X2 [Ptychodera flava]|uniref:cholesterol 24-hydroxylase-like isoform X2 n=1 Tax=Ptychodera flava TaxID=63121 RepID=UPI00396A771E